MPSNALEFWSTPSRIRMRRWLIALLAFGLVPTAIAQVMSTPGQLQVNESGAATYAVPIQVPPGIAGMEPKLALTYSSQAGNGPLGVGWNLSGLSAITRCPQTLAQDGVRGSVRFNNQDRYCMDGQRLVVVAGTYGADGSEYRTERESFSQIKAFGSVNVGGVSQGPVHFIVKSKSGLTMEFGTSSDSRWLTQSGVVRTWALRRISDVKGNMLEANYTVSADNQWQRPASVSYAKSEANPAGAVVDFIYAEARPDTLQGYAAGQPHRIDSRLSGVKTYIGGSVVKDYRLTYQASAVSGRSLLASVQECASDSACLVPVAFTHELATGLPALAAVNGGTQVLSSSVPGGPFNSAQLVKTGDIDGDGLADVMYIVAAQDYWHAYGWKNSGNGSFAVMNGGAALISRSGSIFGAKFELLDVDGDGRADLVVSWATATTTTQYAEESVVTPGMFAVSVWKSLASGHFQPVSGGIALSGNYSQYQTSFGDIDGDGTADLFSTLVSPSGITAYAWRGNGAGAFVPINGGSPVILHAPLTFTAGGQARVLDVNGDGFVDIVVSYAGPGGIRLHTWLGNGAGAFTPLGGGGSILNHWASFSGCQTLHGDLNGDGVPDVMFACADGQGARAYRWLGRGDGFYQAMPNDSLALAQTTFASFQYFQPELVDVDGDGLPDLVLSRAHSSGASVYAFRNTGDGALSAYNGNAPILSHGINYTPYFPVWIDIDGNGVADIVYFYTSTAPIHAYAWINQNAPTADLIKTVRVAVGTSIAETTLRYEPLTQANSTVYTKDSGSVFPTLDLRVPLQVVASTQSSNGIGLANEKRYQYGGLRAEIGTGRGLLGFRWMRATDVSAGLATYAEYRQDWPYTGLVKLSNTRVVNAGYLRESQQEYQAVATAPSLPSLPTASQFVFPTLVTEKSWEPTGLVLPTVTTEYVYAQSPQFGDPTQVKVSLSDGSSKTTGNEYWPPDLSKWISGRLKSATVTHFKP